MRTILYKPLHHKKNIMAFNHRVGCASWLTFNEGVTSANCLVLTHWGRMAHICIVKLTIVGSDNGLLPGRRQAIIWTNAGILLTEPLGTNFSEILIGIQTFSFKKMHLKMLSVKWRPFCLGLNVLTRLALDNIFAIDQTFMGILL